MDWFKSPTNHIILEKLHKVGVWPISEEQTSQGDAVQAFTGQTFVITGTLPGFTRAQAKSFIESHGGRVIGSVSKKTSYLVLGENPGSKYTKAQKLEIAILDEAGLRNLAS